MLRRSIDRLRIVARMMREGRAVLTKQGPRGFTMRVAVPTFGDRVSPRFDCAGGFLLLTVEHETVVDRCEVSAAGWTLRERIGRLVELGVDVVICGGIDRWSAASLRSVGITLYGWVSGSIEENVVALQRGELEHRLLLEDEDGGMRVGSRRK